MKLPFFNNSAKLVVTSLVTALAAGCDGGPITVTITTNSQNNVSSSDSSAPIDDSRSSFDTNHLYNSSWSFSSNNSYSSFDNLEHISSYSNTSSTNASYQPPHAADSSNDLYSSDSYTYSSAPSYGQTVSVGSQDLGLEYWVNLCMGCHTYSGEAPIEGLIDLNVRDWHWEDFSEYVEANMPKGEAENCNWACARHITAFLLDEEGLLDFVNFNPNSPYPDIVTVSSSVSSSGSNSSQNAPGNDIAHSFVFPLDIQSIDDQDIAFAVDKKSGAMIYGALGGHTITSPARVDGTEEWEHATRYRLHDLRFSEEGQWLLVTLDSQVRVLDPTTGEILGAIETSAPATETFSTDGYIVVVTEENGIYTASSYQLGGDQGIRLDQETEFYSPVTFDIELGYVWARLQVEQTKAVINSCIFRGGAFLCYHYGPADNDESYDGYLVHEFDGKFSISPNDEWILTQGNNLLSTDQNLAPSTLYWDIGRQGFKDFDFSPSGTLSVIDNAGRALRYNTLESGAAPSLLDPQGNFGEYNLTKIIALEEGTFAIAKQPNGEFLLVVLDHELVTVGTPQSSSSSSVTSSSPLIASSNSNNSSSSVSVIYTSSSYYADVSSSQTRDSSSSIYIPNETFLLDLNINAIDGKGLAVAVDKQNEVIYYGAIHGKSITSFDGSDAVLWEYKGEQRLFDLTLSEDNDILIATFENEVRAFDITSGEDLGVITTTDMPATDVFAIDRFDVYVATGSDGNYQMTRYIWRIQWLNRAKYNFNQAQQLAIANDQIWSREQYDTYSANIILCGTDENFECNNDPITIRESAGKLIASPNGNWLVTQGNNVISTSGVIEPFILPYTARKPGFIDMDFTDQGALLAIDQDGQVVGYDFLDPHAEPIILNNSTSYYGVAQQLVVLPGGFGVIVKAPNDDSFYLQLLPHHAPAPPPQPPTASSSSSSISPTPIPMSSSSFSSTSETSSSSSAPAPTFDWAMAPSIEWVENGGWQVNTEDYGSPHHSVYVAPSEFGQNATSNPRVDEQFTEITLHVTVFDKSKRYRIQFEAQAASGEDVTLAAKMVDQVIIADDSPSNASIYTVSYELNTTVLNGAENLSNDWTAISGEFDYWGSSGLALKIKSINGASFSFKGLSVEEVGPSTMGDGTVSL